MNIQELIVTILNHARGMWRYRWWVVAVAWLVAVPGCLFVYSMPNVYEASTRVYVDTNSLLQPLLKGLTATQDTLGQVEIVAKAVLTRPNLEKVAHETDLDLRAQTPEQMDELITSLQQRIQVYGGRDNIFTIKYQDPSRDKARAVVAAVLEAFIERSLNSQGDDAEVTEKALANEISVHEQRLREADEALAKFKQENLGYMPGEYGDYYDRLQTAMTAVAGGEQKVALLTKRRDELKRQVEGEEPVFGIMAGQPGQPGTATECSQSGQIASLESQLAGLRVEYTDKHPRLVAMQETIKTLKQQCAAEAQAAQKESGQTVAPSAALLEQNPVYQSLKIQLSTAEVDLAEARAQLSSEQARVAELKRDVDKITEVEAKLKQLNRDYDVIHARHQELLKRWEELQSKKRLDPVTDNVQFRRIDPPFASADPVGPKRTLLLSAVLVLSFGAGLVLAFGLDQLNPVFFTRASLSQFTDIPVLGSITMIVGPDLAGRRRRGRVLWIVACAALVLAIGVAVVFADPGSEALRSLFQGASV